MALTYHKSSQEGIRRELVGSMLFGTFWFPEGRGASDLAFDLSVHLTREDLTVDNPSDS